MTQRDFPEILTLDQAAEYLQVVPRTIQRLIERGELKASKVGRIWRIRKQDIQDYLDNVSNKKPE